MIKKLCFTKGLFSALIPFIFFGIPGVCQQNSIDKPDFEQIFSSDYTSAINFLNTETRIFDSLSLFVDDPDFTIAVVFPEVIRYSVIRDWAETKALEVLYTQYGNKYADFSIGRFQMKPTFAEEIEQEWNRYMHRNGFQKHLPGKFIIADSEGNRYQRIKRLHDLDWQVIYLALFEILMESKYKNTRWPDIQSKLHFFATAYNSGFSNKYSYLIVAGKHDNFHTGIVKPSLCYNYGNIAVDYYLKYRAKQKKN